MKNWIIIIGIALMVYSCGDEMLVPKPPTYLRLDLPTSTKFKQGNSCGSSFQIPEYYTVGKMNMQKTNACDFEIDLGSLNGKLYCFYYHLNPNDTLSKFINFSNDKVDDHKLKATSIEDEKIIRKNDRVFGTFFELKGDVATNYQFYLTDSNQHFFRAELLLNARPNYDSLKPILDFIKKDLKTMTNTFQWK